MRLTPGRTPALRRKRRDELNEIRPDRSRQFFEAQLGRHAARKHQLNATPELSLIMGGEMIPDH
jgi:hypothetical protein